MGDVADFMCNHAGNLVSGVSLGNQAAEYINLSARQSHGIGFVTPHNAGL